MSDTVSKDKILLIEPDENCRSMLGIYFTSLGYEVVTKTDEDYALLMLQYYRPDVVLLAQPGESYNNWYRAVPTNNFFPILRECKQNRIPLIILVDTPHGKIWDVWDGSFFR